MANRLETKSVVRAIGTFDIEEFRTNWISVLEELCERITTLESTVEMQGNVLGEVRNDLAAIKTEAQRLDREAVANKTALT